MQEQRKAELFFGVDSKKKKGPGGKRTKVEELQAKKGKSLKKGKAVRGGQNNRWG